MDETLSTGRGTRSNRDRNGLAASLTFDDILKSIDRMCLATGVCVRCHAHEKPTKCQENGRKMHCSVLERKAVYCGLYRSSK